MDGQCSFCGLSNHDRICKGGEKAPPFCCTKIYQKNIEQSLQTYKTAPFDRIAIASAKNERNCYDCTTGIEGIPRPIKCRLEETIDFCKASGYHKLGFAFCGALQKEAAIVAKILCSHGFQLVSVMCKVGGLDKMVLGLPDEEKLHPGKFEPMCNPIAQAAILNESNTEFNIVMGLCVGHDALFLANSQALCTVLAVKDRLLGHNPLAAVYTSHTYYHYLEG